MDKNQEEDVEEEELLSGCAKKKELANICVCVYMYTYKNTHIEHIYVYINCSAHQF